MEKETMNREALALNGKVAVVTGAGRGIGQAIAIIYAKAGAAVCCVSRNESEIDATVKEIENIGGRGLAVGADVTDFTSMQEVFKKTSDTFGGIDILVINAGVHLDRRSVEDSVPEDWRTTVEVNLFGAYYCAKAAIPYLKQRGAGKIITMGSGVGHRGHTASSAYAASKAALWSLTTVLAQELWPYKITVNELIPGPVRTSLTAGQEDNRHHVFQIESEWIKTPDDVAPLALFLATQPDVGPTAQSFSLMRRPK